MQKRSLTLAEVIVMIVVFVILFCLLHSMFFADTSHRPGRGSCASNLRQIGVALNCYASENRDKFPCIPFDSSRRRISVVVGPDINQGQSVNDGQSPWRNLVSGVEDPFGTDSKGNYVGPIKTPTVTASLWLLCRTNQATPKVFVCPSVRAACLVDDPLEDNGTVSPKYFCDFYTDPSAGTLISFSFVLPCSANWAATVKPGYVIGGDENNGNDPAYASDQTQMPGPIANSTNHRGEGQNVLRVDASVWFEKSPYVGLDQDNIYTALPDRFSGNPGSTSGILKVRPGNNRDTVLIPNRQADLKLWNRIP